MPRRGKSDGVARPLLKPLKATMPSTTSTILDQINAEKTKVSERLARLDYRTRNGRHSVDRSRDGRASGDACQQDAALEETHIGCRRRNKSPAAGRGRGRPPKAAATKSAARKPSAPSLGERVLALATGRTRQELYLVCCL